MKHYFISWRSNTKEGWMTCSSKNSVIPCEVLDEAVKEIREKQLNTDLLMNETLHIVRFNNVE